MGGRRGGDRAGLPLLLLPLVARVAHSLTQALLVELRRGVHVSFECASTCVCPYCASVRASLMLARCRNEGKKRQLGDMTGQPILFSSCLFLEAVCREMLNIHSLISANQQGRNP